jgi:hypothetical protein
VVRSLILKRILSYRDVKIFIVIFMPDTAKAPAFVDTYATGR